MVRLTIRPRSLRGVISPLLLLIVGAGVVYSQVRNSPPEDFQTLQRGLVTVHFPAEYRMVAQHRTGIDCNSQCSITQTWVWAPVQVRTASAACVDVLHSLNAGPMGPAESNSPIPANASCDYFGTVVQGLTKFTIEAVVKTRDFDNSSGFRIELSARFPY